ncbi:DoxX family protein [Saccharopolyspora phatthalungensis]|uniref:Putative membrane protein YphA (DoxX/SURF4 family) n=1 Tax=Saccharopolyspora phatthalungensis TaxID=664693 RepID=A0A840PZQ6_9PSEU|nr:DoxX family protein [Saccharopolyspora phatthalungensis]MBB5155762.1 putative membrane protein YphA (DoxX/SURF4 family) [Saccharopolyspora phatthalungensis]
MTTAASRPAWQMWLFHTTAPRATVLIRIAVGGIFLSEGIQKFLFPGELGTGRFAKIALLPQPAVWANADGIFEIICGVLIILGLVTRLATIPMIVDMVGAQVLTKFTMAAHQGAWVYLHESRVEHGQLLGLVFLLIVGAGGWSLDAALASRMGMRRNENSPLRS